MQKNKSYISQLLSKIPVLLLYVCFFLVQFSSHYNNNATASTKISFTVQNSISKTILSKADKSNEQKLNIRLNKRFAPSPILCCNPFFTVIPIINGVANKQVFVYKSPYLPSSHLIVKALRGPPAAVVTFFFI